jgi:hypothetical protein
MSCSFRDPMIFMSFAKVWIACNLCSRITKWVNCINMNVYDLHGMESF